MATLFSDATNKCTKIVGVDIRGINNAVAKEQVVCASGGETSGRPVPTTAADVIHKFGADIPTPQEVEWDEKGKIFRLI